MGVSNGIPGREGANLTRLCLPIDDGQGLQEVEIRLDCSMSSVTDYRCLERVRFVTIGDVSDTEITCFD